jgi:predicted glycosyltransferase
MGGVNPAIVFAAKILGKKAIIFTDSEPESLKYPIADYLTVPFADAILTLNSVRHSYGTKEIRANSYKELAYLHPNWFRPNPDVLKDAGLHQGEKFVLLRFVAWGAYHDIGNGSFDYDSKRKLIRELKKYARVFISSESKLPDEFENYRFPLRSDRMHDFLYHAHLLICDSQTMATEAAIVGTPAIRCNSFVGEKDMGNFVELEQKYDMIYNYSDPNQAIDKAVELIRINNLKEQWQRKKDTVLNDKIDLSRFMIDYVNAGSPERHQVTPISFGSTTD